MSQKKEQKTKETRCANCFACFAEAELCPLDPRYDENKVFRMLQERMNKNINENDRKG